MKLRGKTFPRVFNSAGARGVFGKGYWFHRILRLFLRYQGAGFVSKTTTLKYRKGNMLFRKDGITPYKLFPDCIYVDFFRKLVLNSLGLGGLGALDLFLRRQWQKIKEPFLISFMSVETEKDGRMNELREFIEIFQYFLPEFKKDSVGLEINFSCPNVGLNPSHLVDEAGEALDIAAELKIPLVANFNPLAPPEALVKINNADAISISNTIPWGYEGIDWEDLFGTKISPLSRYGGGGLSGPELLPFVISLAKAVKENTDKPVIAGGGIISCRDVDLLLQKVKVDAIKLGVISILNILEVQNVINYAIRKLK